MLTREQILAAPDLQTRTVPVPEWGGEVIVRMLSAREAADWQAMSSKADQPDEERALSVLIGLVILSTIDAAGGPLFTAEDVTELQKKNPTVIRRIFDACLDMNAATADEVAALEKN